MQVVKKLEQNIENDLDFLQMFKQGLESEEPDVEVFDEDFE